MTNSGDQKRNSFGDKEYVPYPGLKEESQKLSLTQADIAAKDKVFNASAETVYRFFNPDTGAHLYTVSENERDYIIANLRNFKYENATYLAVNRYAEGATPVYRFYNTISNVHFYTINETEKDYILQNLSHFNFENISYYAFPGSKEGAIPIHRFYRAREGIHFFTPSEQERNFISENLPQYAYENIAFYAFPLGSSQDAPGSFQIQNIGNTTDNTPTISWEESSQAQDYRVDISKSSDCRNPVFSRVTSGARTVESDALQDGTYYICIRAINQIGSFRTAENNALPFTVNATSNKPGEFNISTSGSTNDKSPQINWTASQGAASYTLRVAPDVACSNNLVNQTGILTTSFESPELATGKYYICVNALGPNNENTAASNNGVSIQVLLVLNSAPIFGPDNLVEAADRFRSGNFLSGRDRVEIFGLQRSEHHKAFIANFNLVIEFLRTFGIDTEAYGYPSDRVIWDRIAEDLFNSSDPSTDLEGLGAVNRLWVTYINGIYSSFNDLVTAKNGESPLNLITSHANFYDQAASSIRNTSNFLLLYDRLESANSFIRSEFNQINSNFEIMENYSAILLE